MPKRNATTAGLPAGPIEYATNRALVIPEVYLPPYSIFGRLDTIRLDATLSAGLEAQFDLVSWVAASSAPLKKIKGLKKDTPDAFDEVQGVFVNKSVKQKLKLPDGYNFFGNDDNEANLELFVKHNPFHANALIGSVSGTGKQAKKSFEIVSLPAFGVSNAAKSPSWFSKLVAQLDIMYTRVNAKFDADFKLTSITCYDKNGNPVQKSRADACAALLLLLSWYSECLHALIHCFHYLLVSCAYSSTKDSPLMATWVEPYLPNIFVKYFEVAQLLFSAKGTLVYQIKSDRDPVLALIREILCSWGTFRTADEFVNGFLFRGSDAAGAGHANILREGGVCSEFLKHVALIGPFADEITAEFAKRKDQYDTANAKIAEFMRYTGDGVSSMDNMNVWIQLMSVTGLYHGTTLSMSRLIMTQPVLNLVQTGDSYGDIETGFLGTVGGTISGMMPGRYVFSDTILPDKLADVSVRQIQTKYAALTGNLKAAYYREISADAAKFRDQGWVLTDLCLDGIDGKQLTITTYI